MDNYISLPLKYRPQTMDDVVGQKHIVKTLRNAIKLDRIGHAYLFIGPAGTGKTSFARIWSKEMNCMSDDPPCNKCRVCKEISEGRNLDVLELNAADKRKIEDIRESLSRLQYKPTSKYKILILDECHMLTGESWNALLKDLEEPKEYVIFILCTTNPEKIPNTILSRCQTFQFNSIELSDVEERLSYICDEEGFSYDPEAVKLIAEYSKGGMRDAVSALEQVALCSGDDITVDTTVDMLGLIKTETINQLVDSILEKDESACYSILSQLMEDDKSLDVLFNMLMERFRKIINESLCGKGSYSLNKLDCFRISKAFLECDKSMRYSCDNYFVFLSLFDTLINGNSTNVDTRISKLEEALKNGTFTAATRPDSAFVANIKAKLDKSEDTQSQPEQSADELVSFIASKTGGKVVK